MKQVVVTVDKNGKTKIEVNGAKGASCLRVVEDLTRALQAQVVDDQKKPDFFVEETAADFVTSGR